MYRPPSETDPRTCSVFNSETGEQIGTVTPWTSTETVHWEARDMDGHSHGNMWIRAWYAADALTRALEGCRR